MPPRLLDYLLRNAGGRLDRRLLGVRARGCEDATADEAARARTHALRTSRTLTGSGTWSLFHATTTARPVSYLEQLPLLDLRSFQNCMQAFTTGFVCLPSVKDTRQRQLYQVPWLAFGKKKKRRVTALALLTVDLPSVVNRTWQRFLKKLEKYLCRVPPNTIQFSYMINL